jgi:hypothetical protein
VDGDHSRLSVVHPLLAWRAGGADNWRGSGYIEAEVVEDGLKVSFDIAKGPVVNFSGSLGDESKSPSPVGDDDGVLVNQGTGPGVEDSAIERYTCLFDEYNVLKCGGIGAALGETARQFLENLVGEILG